ncbi:OLC1v1010650C1 [Oldenlandia corymbosa var. corymbosa]|uniref:OLC1v1010650C1 n=1 Tax=Oldenlandia corymbosa var. corymbosa TaxID=529605 RepID=A0AAV1DUB3_OLDCO|nr:OLC1v1010650C1 [Oldenlandia corymbosa var. corymbosa]
MVRILPNIPVQGLHFVHPSLAIVTMAIAVVSILSVVAFLCGSERAKKLNRRRGEKPVRLGSNKTPVMRLQSSLSSKTHLLAKMISWRKVQDDQGDGDEEDLGHFDGHVVDDDEEGAVWKKTIIKGEKCRPLDFSGKILYDSDGNLIPDSSSHPQQSQ